MRMSSKVTDDFTKKPNYKIISSYLYSTFLCRCSVGQSFCHAEIHQVKIFIYFPDIFLASAATPADLGILI